MIEFFDSFNVENDRESLCHTTINLLKIIEPNTFNHILEVLPNMSFQFILHHAKI